MSDPAPELHRHFGLWHATALNVSQVVGAGVFLTVPLMVNLLPGPYALLGWALAGLLMLLDGLVWGELGAMLPGSGGSYLYLLEAYGRERWGRLLAFLFVWQFLVSGPLEVGSALIGIAIFSGALHPAFNDFNNAYTWKVDLIATDPPISVVVGPTRLLAFGLGVLILVLLYRRVTTLGRLAITVWLGVLAILAWIMVEGLFHGSWHTVVDQAGVPERWPAGSEAHAVGKAMLLAMYSYLGYYNVCYLGDEVRDPGRTIPRAVLLSAVMVMVLLTGTHVAMLSVVPWQEIPTDPEQLGTYNLAADFMARLHGPAAASLIALLLVWSCFGSVFAALLGYSRIPYGAARYGHFFQVFGKVHPVHHIPHVALLAVGGMTLFWSFFDLQVVIDVLLATRILEQFITQIVGVMLLRARQPDRPRPFRIWLYPLPCLLALVGWAYLYWASGAGVIAGLLTLGIGLLLFLGWAASSRTWPFGPEGVSHGV